MASEELIAENEKQLAAFASSPNATITPELEQILLEIRQTGVPCYSWEHLKVLLVAKLNLALDEVLANDKNASTVGVGWSPTNKSQHDERRSNIAELLKAFDAPPFTLQRLTEVILEPQKSYKSLNKLINALEKLLAVNSTILVVDPRSGQTESEPDLPQPLVISAPAVQVVEGNAELDVVARAPWSNAAESSS